MLGLEQISAEPLHYGFLETWALFVILLPVFSLSMVQILHQLWVCPFFGLSDREVFLS